METPDIEASLKSIDLAISSLEFESEIKEGIKQIQGLLLREKQINMAIAERSGLKRCDS